MNLSPRYARRIHPFVRIELDAAAQRDARGEIGPAFGHLERAHVLSMPELLETGRVLRIGVGATAVMDLWLLLLAGLGIRAADFALVGRWIGHLAQGRVAHDSISTSRPIPQELRLGWLTPLRRRRCVCEPAGGPAGV